MSFKQSVITLLYLLVLAGCSSSGRYSISDDVAPEKPLSVDHIEDAHPKYEPYSRGGNRNYSLRGKSYEIIKDPKDFTQKGIASWYGKKFHGHLTSNGEIYDMYSMSAAHKTLPIPSYVKVTNLDNGKETVVRINDRGPFHEGRIIDLSYAAAFKLDVIKTGTANVQIEHISVANPGADTQYAIQVAASTHEDRTKSLASELSEQFSVETFIEHRNGKYRAMIGPFNDFMHSEKTLEKVKQGGYSGAFIKKITQ
ncbi:septal ring lytic transglycosylase RlpA family protein [Vibrio hannami]|uniref:septal ring lytic transglycosylase RlpA family protein n=1 Tax=Vibrio hannami TaxID=2717094 RepID=UPI00240F65C9|nr:septal ring lytic transglycosylase RlpA family protein [Vibrio hannami]MDG3087410.1 septal ring lytic transglycosylase RlpA family protein [Vibrio hannami]